MSTPAVPEPVASGVPGPVAPRVPPAVGVPGPPGPPAPHADRPAGAQRAGEGGR